MQPLSPRDSADYVGFYWGSLSTYTDRGWHFVYPLLLGDTQVSAIRRWNDFWVIIHE